MNTTKKLMTLLLALLLPITAIALPPYSYTNYEFEVDGIYYIIENGNACVTFQSWTSGIHVTNYHGDVIIPATVTYQDMTYPVTIIDSYAFYYCEGLTSITIPASITEIRGSAFLGCTGLTRVNITDVEAWCKIKMGDNPIRYARHLYLNDAEVTELTIPDGITSIGQNAFQGWAGLTSVKIPETVTSIGNNAFEGCTGLSSLSIPNSVTEIGQIAFERCTGLSSITLGNAVKTIDSYAFAGCTALTGIVIPDSVTSIGMGAFSGCTALTGIVIPDAVTSIGMGAFSGCTSLAIATLSKSITTIGAGTFRNCTSLTKIDIPESVNEIGTFAFDGCSQLSNVTIGSSVITIGKDAFQNAPAIGLITCMATTPPLWTDMSMFTANVYNHAELHVPIDTEMAYKTNQSWGQFVNIIGDVTIETPGDEDGYEYVPFVREGVKWTYSIDDYRFFEDYETNPARGDNKVYRTLEIKGDTVINGKTYKAMHMCTDDVYSEPKDVVPIYLREENKMVYGIVPDGKHYDDATLGHMAIYSGEEFLLYDFQDPVTYWENLINDDWLNIPLQMDTIKVGGHYVKRLFDERQEGDYFQIIEGIGAMGMNSYPLCFLMPVATGIHMSEYYSLVKVEEDGAVIYPHPGYAEDRYMPLIREGVKWIYEKVTIQGGDTICQYYTYEFNGNHPEKTDPEKTDSECVCKALYRYDGQQHDLDVENDSIVAGMMENEAIIKSYFNEPMKQVDSQDRNMINLGSGNSYTLYELATNHGWLVCHYYYVMNQKESFFNDANFVKADPIMIDGYLCSRLAYLDELGDTLAYVVEGIGFDSYDMGDLLTPFTRKPDPNADYQEWCGLSHVIKDGKIIYKGMCYNPNVEPVIPGDANGDGEITIADANSVIDIVIMGGNASHPRMPAIDMNDDGEVTIADVNVIIDIILNNNLIY